MMFENKNKIEVKNIHLLIFMSFILFISYFLTTPSFVTMEDSGLFIMSSYFCGLPQPSGYPLYILISKIFTLIPIGSIAFRVAFLNNVLGVVSCIFIYLIIYHFTKNKLASFLTGLLLGFSEAFWFQAVIAEVYMLQTLLFLIALYLSLKLDEDFSNKKLFLFSLFSGLMFSNHLAISILVFPTFIIILWEKKIDILKKFHFVLLFFVIGLFPYIHLFTSNLYSDFFFYYPIKNIEDFFRYVTRFDYSNADVMSTYNFFHGVKYFAYFVYKCIFNFSIIGFLLLIAGFIIGFKIFKKHQLFAFIYGILSSSLFLLFLRRMEYTELTREQYMNYQLIPFVLCIIIAGVAFSFLLKMKLKNERIYQTVLIAIVIISIGFLFFSNYNRNNLKKDSFAYDYANILLEFLPKNSVLILDADYDTFPVAYVNLIEKKRKDVIITSQNGVGLPEKIFDIKNDDTIAKMSDKIVNYISEKFQNNRRIFTTAMIRQFNDENPFPFYYKSYGIYYEILQNEGSKLEINNDILKRIIHFLEKTQKNEYKTQWAYYRNVVISNFCRYLMDAKIDHSIFQTHVEGKILLAEKLCGGSYDDWKEADKYFLSLFKEIDLLSVERQTIIANNFVVNRIRMLNASSLNYREKIKMYQETMDYVFPIVRKNPVETNALALTVAELAKQLPVKIDRKYLYNKFHTYEKFQGLF